VLQRATDELMRLQAVDRTEGGEMISKNLLLCISTQDLMTLKTISLPLSFFTSSYSNLAHSITKDSYFFNYLPF
jgi:hypothetical protein